jgi:dTDP-4-amino-4,6-dideoxygalactose transaminase
MAKLAINGGEPIRKNLLPAQETIGKEEKKAVLKILDNKLLSGYRGNSSSAFLGGTKVQEFEKFFVDYFVLDNYLNYGFTGIASNSCTSSLIMACGAIGLEPGDEVIVTPWSMSCSASAPLWYGAIPVFADIEEDYFCLDPKSIKEKITDKTRAIIVVDLFGQPFNPEIIDIAKKHNLYIIEDAAQAIGSKYGNIYAGFLGDIGCFSFTQGKHLTAGEGGISVSKNLDLVHRMRLIRNHAEAVISDINDKYGLTKFFVSANVLSNGEKMRIDLARCILEEKELIVFDEFTSVLGANFRLTEIQAAIMIEQLKKLRDFAYRRTENVFYFNEALSKIPCISTTKIRKNCTHSYYVQAFKFDNNYDVHRDKFIEAVKAELKPQKGRADLGVAIGCGYTKPLYLTPLYQKKMHWALKNTDYNFSLPVVEKLWKDDLFLWTLQGLSLNDKDRKDIVDAFYKVWENRGEL